MAKSETQPRQEPPVDEVATPPYQMRYRWVMLALVWLLYMFWGVVARLMAPLVTPILEDLDISYSQMGIILGSWPLTYIAVAIVAGAILDRWGIRKSLFFGIIVIGLSEALRYFANGFTSMFFIVALFGLGGPMLSVGAPKTISLWFRGKDRSTAVGIYMTGPTIGGLIALSTANSIVMPLTGYSWRLTFAWYSLPVFAAAVVWWFMARDIKSTEAKEEISIIKVFIDLVKMRNIQLILIMGFLSFALAHGFTDWLPKILEIGGLPPAIAGYAASLPLFIGIPTVLLLPRLTPPHLRKHVVAFMSLLGGISLLIIVKTSGVPLVLGLLLFGAANFSMLPMLILILMDSPEIGSKYMGSAGGMFFCVAEIGGFAGPFVLGVLKDLTDDFLIGAGLFTALAVARSIMALLVKTKPPD